ncbi:ABC transporter ATP-binding protein [Rhodococcus gannanensis]|uniref:ABC transporter ATP-binding protein n=1 Tax=Rhodococcus gannanensis TaxID=1960308 RepID=A0ABW4P936_9NOCA
MSDSSAKRSWPNARLLWTFIRPNRWSLLVGMILGLLFAAAGLAMPMLIKVILDALARGESIVTPAVILGAVLAAAGIIGFVYHNLMGALAARVVFEARESMVRRYFRATVASIAKRPSGELVTRVTSDTVLLREATSTALAQLVLATVSIVGTLVLMATLDLVLFLVTLGGLVIVGTAAAVLMPAMGRSQRLSQESVGKLGGGLEGALHAIRTVKSSRAESREAERIMIDARESRRHSVRAARRGAVVWAVVSGGMQLAIAGSLAFGAWRVGAGALEVSGLIAFLLYAFQLAPPVAQLAADLATIQAGIAAAARIREVHDMEVEESGDGDTVVVALPVRDAESGPPVLEFVDVTARYAPGSEPALQGVSLAIPARGHTAIVGPSGAGKTTMFSLLLRFLHPDDGEILLDGTPYSQLPFDQVRARLAYVEQETPVVPGTIRSNVQFTYPEATEDEIWAALRAVHLEDTVRAMEHGLDTDLTSTNVSGGQRQRIALARAIVRQPEVLLLDEATAQIDGRTEAAIQDVINELAQTGAVVTIAHRLSTVIDADTILVMDNGRIRARGTHAELMGSDELYRDLVTALRISTGGVALAG